MNQEFHKIWRIVKKKDYELQFELNQKNSRKQYQWWKEEPTEPDEGFDH